MYTISSSLKKHRLYVDFLKVKSRLARYQFVCWIAGGAVRDFCLGREVNEFDLVTDATTEVLKGLFPEALLVGESFGVLKIPLENNEFFDLTTFRQESDYLDGRRPSQVSAATPFKDAERRDFTINAFFWDDVQNIIIDYKGGLFDLTSRKLMCVGDAEVRFSEDYLRIMRLVRFAIQLKFEIESKTLAAAYKFRSKIKQISGERIWTELIKIEKASAWDFAFKQDLFLILLEEIFETKPVVLTNKVPEQASLFLIIYLLNPEIDFSDILKKRLKVSNREIKNYHSIQFIMKHLDKLSAEQWAYEVEKSPHYVDDMNMLIDVGMVPKVLSESIKNTLNLFSEPLIAASELVGLIPNKHISDELKYLRIHQFRKIYKTKVDAISYLKLKYGNNVEINMKKLRQKN